MTAFEIALIGACRADEDAFHLIRHRIRGEYFADLACRSVWRAMEAIVDSGGHIDDVAIAGKLSERANTEVPVQDLSRYVCQNPRHAQDYAKSVAEHGQKRMLQTALATLSADNTLGSDELLERTQAEVGRIASARLSAEEMAPVEVDRAQQEKRERAYRTGNPVTGVPTGFAHLDAVTTGWNPGDLIAIGAHTHAGKSQFVCELALAAMRVGTPVALYESELTVGAVRERMAAIHANVSLPAIAELEIDPTCLTPGYSWLQEQPLVVRRVKMTPAYLRSMIRLDQSKSKTGLVIIDHINHMTGDGKDARERMVHVTGALKDIALQLEIPIIAVCHFARRPHFNNTGDAIRPVLSDFKESSSVEQDADHCLLLWRPALGADGKGPYKPQDLIVLHDKNRATMKISEIPMLFAGNGRIIERDRWVPKRRPTPTEQLIADAFPGTQFDLGAPATA